MAFGIKDVLKYKLDVNECEDGTHDCDRELAICLNTEGSYTCQCRPGYTGDGTNCSDVNECISGDHNCHDLGVCTNNHGSFTCHCQRGYTGNGTWCAACPAFSICVQTSPTSCDCWCKFSFHGNPEMAPCDDSMGFSDCQDALGMENGAVSDAQIKASSEYASNHAAPQGRLHFQATATKTGAWSARTNDVNQWLQVDLISQYTKVTGVATQGRNSYSQWVTKYNLQYGDDGVNFLYYMELGGTEKKDFTGNTDRDTVVYHDLFPPITARYIRFRPVAWYSYISMRMELYGCQVTVPEVKILNGESQPDSPKRFRRDETRTFEASFSLEKSLREQISFNWTISSLSFPPLNISENEKMFVHNTRELNVGRHLLQVGLYLVVFELQIAGMSLASRDFAFLKITESALVAKIAGGTAVERSIRKPVILDGTQSYDPEDEGKKGPLIYSWYCFQEQDIAPDLNISRLINGSVREVLANSSSSISRLSRETSDSGFLNLARSSLNETSDESSWLLSKLTNVTGKRLLQLPNTVFKFYPRPGHVILDTTKLISNNTYFVLLKVHKGVRIAEYTQSIHFRDEELVNIEIRCVLNCAWLISSSSGISLRTDLRTTCDPTLFLCRRPPLKYRWKMFLNEGNDSHPQWKHQTDLPNLLATKVDSKHFVLKRIAPGSSYRVTVDVLSPDGARGWASYQFETSAAPSGGTCHVTELETEQMLGTSLNISCQGWTDKSEPLMYQFYRKLEEGRFDMLSYGGLPYSVVNIMPAVDEVIVHIKVAIVNILGTTTEVFLQIQIDPPTLPQTEEQIHAELSKQVITIESRLKSGQINLAIQQTETLLRVIKMSEDRINEQFHKQILKRIISKMSNVSVKTLERLLQITTILGKATEDDTKLSSNITALVVERLLKISPVLLLKAKYKTDTRLLGDVARSYMYCISNVKKFTSLSKLQDGRLDEDGTGNRSRSDEAWTRSQRLSQRLTEIVTNTMLSLKQPGEEYTVIRNKLESTVLGKQEVEYLSHLAIHDKDAGFEFPLLGNETLSKIFGSTSEVGVQMITYAFNPQSSVNSSNKINSEVVNIELKDDHGLVLNITDLPNDIVIEIPVSQNYGNATPPTEHFLNPGLMQYHIVNVQQTHTTVKFSIRICLHASVTAYIRHGEKPTESVFDDVVILPSHGNSSNSDCQNGDNNMRNVWITAEQTGNYYLGLLGIEETETVQSRNRRSLLTESSSQDRCVTFKPPPPTPSPPPEFVVIKPKYDPAKSANYSLQVNTFWCAYWNDAEEMWTNEGCKVGQNSNGSFLECLCNHLTSFGGDLLVAPNTVDFVAVKQTLENLEPSDVLVLAAVCSVFLVYVLVLLIARRADKKDIAKNSPLIPLKGSDEGGYQYEVSITTGGWRNSGTSANVSMILYGLESASDVISLTTAGKTDRELFVQGNTDNFLISVPQPLGPLVKVQIGHDNSGKTASWFLSEISVVDSQTGQQWLFTCYRWLALERDDGNTTRVFYSANVEGSEIEFKRKFSMLQKTGFADEHLWWSVVSKQPGNSFSRVQRASCCCCFLFLFMVTSAMFYETETANQQTITIGPFKVTPSQLIIALQTVLITLPPSVLITFLFRNSGFKNNAQGRRYDHMNSQKRQCLLPHFCVYIAWFLCISTAITSALFTIFYSLMWRGEKSARWLSSVVLSLTGDVFVSQPVKIIMVSVIVASQCGRALRLRRSAQDNNVQPLFDLSLDEIKQAKKFKTNERKMFKFIKKLIFLILFFLLLMIVCYSDKNEHRYQLTDSTENELQNFDEIKNNNQFWRWMNEVFVRAIFPDGWYNSQEEKISEYIGNKRSILVGMPRLRQLRVKKNTCEGAAIFKKMINFCHDSYSRIDEDTNIWNSQIGTFNRSLSACPENWEYSTDEQFGGFDSWGRFAVYRGGGYIANLGYNKLTARKVIDDLIKNNWIDSQTRAVIVEFSLFNPSSNLLSVMSYFFEALPSGYSGTFKNYGILPLNSTDSQAHDTYLFFVLLFGVFLLCYLIMECIKMFQQKCSYFKSAWNWMELFQILTASLALLFQWIKSKEVTIKLAKLKENPFVPVSFHQALVWGEAETVAICITSAIATLRLLKCFHFNSQVVKLSSFLKSRLPTVTSFFLIFCVLSTSYAVSGTIAFGSDNLMFSSFAKAFISQFLMVIGGNGLMEGLEEGGFIMGRLFVVSFFLTAIIIITNMFVAILDDSYSNSCLDQGKEELEIADFMMKRILQTLLGYTPEENGDSSSSKRKADQGSRDELSERTSVAEEDTFENEAWRSNWSFAAKITPVMYRSRKVSFANSEPFGDSATVMNGDEDDELCSVWETFKTKKTLNRTQSKDCFHSGISEESSSVESEEITCGTNLGDGYGRADVASTSSDDPLLHLNNMICHILTARHSSLVDDDDDKDYDGVDDSDKSDDVHNAAYVNDVVDDGDATATAAAADDDDHASVEHLACNSNANRDVWKEILHLLDDTCLDDYPHNSSPVGLGSYDNPALVKDRD
ncbi:polycystin family receptor for egg jelly-like [Oculina patagonica]